MARAEFKLPNGTIVTVEGDPSEIHKILHFYGGVAQKASTPERAARPRSGRMEGAPAGEKDEAVDHVHAVVTQVKSSKRAEAIESKILDQRSQLNRILLPLFIVHEEMENRFALTSGEIAKITRELGVPIGRPDVSNILAKEASKYVLGDRARVHGKPVRYKLSRRGVQYVSALLG